MQSASFLTHPVLPLRIHMPPSLQLIAASASDFAQAAELQVLPWLDRHGLCTAPEPAFRLASMRPAGLAAYGYPLAGAEQTATIAKFIAWLFLLDDRNDETHWGRLPDQCEHALMLMHESVFGQGPRCHRDPFATALSEIWAEVQPSMPSSWQRRFSRHLADYFMACAHEAAHRALDHVPSPHILAQLRRNSGAVWPSFDLIEWVEGYALPPSVYFSNCCQAMLTAAVDVVCWTNDLLTLEKEMRCGDVQNLVLVTRHARRCSLQQALDHVVELTDARIRDFLDAERALPAMLRRLTLGAEAERHIHHCIAMLRAWMSGHVEWGMCTGRYAPPPLCLPDPPVRRE